MIMSLNVLLLLFASGYCIKISYQPQNFTVKLYDGKNEQGKLFLLNFTSTQIFMHPKLQSSTLYLTSQHKYHIKDFEIRYTYHPEKNHADIWGVIGLNHNGSFIQGLKRSLGAPEVKLLLQTSKEYIKVLTGHCQTPIFPPFHITAGEKPQKTFEVSEVSTSFLPDEHFLELLEKAKRKNKLIQVSKSQLRQQLRLQLNQQVVFERTAAYITNCNIYPGSQNYECEFPLEQQHPNYGRFLLAFDFYLCQHGIQLYSEGPPEKPMDYFFLHLILIIVQIVLVICYQSEDILFGVIGKVRSHNQF